MSLAVAMVVGTASPRRRLVVAGRGPSRGWRVATAAVVVVTAGLLPMSVSVAVGVLTVATMLRIRRSNRRRRAAAEAQGMADALEVLVAELRTGVHPVRAFGSAAADTTGPVATALSTVAARASLGADVARGLSNAGAGSAVGAEWNRLALSWRLAVDNGLPVSVMMRATQMDIVERQRFSSRVQASLAGARATATILAGLPLLGLALGEVIGADPVAFLAGDGIGGGFLVAGTVLACCGLHWADRITDRVGA